MTDYSELLDQGRVKRGQFARRQVEDCLRIARRDLETAKMASENSAEWAFNIAYNAMYQAGRSFMFHSGYRATYDMVGTISKREAEDAFSIAREFVARMERLVNWQKE
jgi:uncharacterized protein (UPF0332 family)